MTCGADLVANELITSLTAGEDFTIPEVDLDGPAFQFPFDPDGPLYKPVAPITNEALTTREVNGTGTFDSMMSGMSAHILAEYEAGRITGDDYTKAYISLTEAALGNGVQFLLGRDRAFWEAQTAQIMAFTARVGLETAKVQLATVQLEALNQRANYALTKMRLATESINYCTAEYNLQNLMPAQLANLLLEQEGQVLSNDTIRFTLTSMLPKQLEMLTTQEAGEVIKNSTGSYNLATMLPQQLSLLIAQETMVGEQTEAQRAQTSDLRTDGQPVVGVLGKQKDLYTQQITSYKRDSEIKGGKLFTDAWITMKSIDEGLLPPEGFTNTSIDTVLTAIKTNNELN